MASTYTTRLRVELQADGENDSIWGQKANSAFERFDLAISGFTSIPLSDANYTLSIANSDSGADEASSYLLKFTGTLTAGRNIVVPTASGRWIIWNATTGGFDLTVKTSGGTGATCKAGYITPTFSDGTNVYPSGPAISTAGDLLVTGDFTVSDDLVVTDDATITGAATVGETLGVTGVATFSNVVKTAQSSDIASASTVDLATATGNYVSVTGTTSITAFGTVQAGTIMIVAFAGILTLTHNATSLILPTGANITTAAGDVAIMVSLGSGNWKCASYVKVDGTPVAGNTKVKDHQIFTSSGTFSKSSLPSTIGHVIVHVWGGGGGGGGGRTSDSTRGGGGGGGGYSRKRIAVGDLSSSETVTVGAGGAGGATDSIAAGTAGGTSSFGSHCSATGGTGGVASNGAIQAGVNGGSGSSGDLNLTGGQSTLSFPDGNTGGGGRGGNAAGGGGPGACANVSNNGQMPGGGGSAANHTAGASGGTGGAGLVIVEW